MNVTQIKTRVWDRLGEDSSNPLRYTSEMILEFMNDGIELFAALTSERITKTTLTSIKDQRFYPLPTDLIRILAIKDVTTSIPLLPTHWREFDGSSPRLPRTGPNRSVQSNWQVTGADRATHFFAFSWDEVSLWPIANTTGREYALTYIQAPGATLESINQEFGVTVAMTGQQFTSEFGVMAGLTGFTFTSEFGVAVQVADDENAPLTDIPQDYHMALVDYTVGRCLMINAKGDRLNRARGLIDSYRVKITDAQAQRGNASQSWAQTNSAILV